MLIAAPLSAQTRAAPEEIARAVDSLAARIIASGLTPGLGVAIAMDGRIVFSKAYGFADVTNRIPADERTLWYVASTSKSYTGSAFRSSRTRARSISPPDRDAAARCHLAGGRIPRGLTLAHFLSHTITSMTTRWCRAPRSPAHRRGALARVDPVCPAQERQRPRLQQLRLQRRRDGDRPEAAGRVALASSTARSTARQD
jgi:hypothetical protein